MSGLLVPRLALAQASAIMRAISQSETVERTFATLADDRLHNTVTIAVAAERVWRQRVSEALEPMVSFGLVEERAVYTATAKPTREVWYRLTPNGRRLVSEIIPMIAGLAS